jgi:hypothetical protein
MGVTASGYNTQHDDSIGEISIEQQRNTQNKQLMDDNRHNGSIKQNVEKFPDGVTKPITEIEHIDFICNSIKIDTPLSAPITELIFVSHWHWAAYICITGYRDREKFHPDDFLKKIVNIPNSKNESILYNACLYAREKVIRILFNCPDLLLTHKSDVENNFLDALFVPDGKKTIVDVLWCLYQMFSYLDDPERLDIFCEALFKSELSKEEDRPIFKLCKLLGTYNVFAVKPNELKTEHIQCIKSLISILLQTHGSFSIAKFLNTVLT